MPNQFNIGRLIDESKLGRFQWTVILICGAALIMDGFDVQSMGYVAPAIIQGWGIQNSVLGPVFSAGLFGIMIGSLLFSVLADRFGRRPILIGATLCYSGLTILTARANSVEELMILRFIAGIGLGGIMPNAMALAGEYSPSKLRVPVMTMISGGFTAGAAVGGFVAAWLIPTFGWRAVFYFGGTVPLVVALLMIFLLPDSLQFLALNGKHQEIRKWLTRIDPSAPVGEGMQYIVNEEHKRGVPVIHLFREGRATATLMLWVINFMNLLNLYFLSSWLPTVVKDGGHATSIAVLAGTAVQVGGTLGTVGISWLISRFGFIRVLASYFTVGCASVALIGQPALPLVGLFAVVFTAGWCIVGGQPAVESLAAVYYPTYLRSTGIGWGLGIGRIGAIIGPVVGGQLMALKWSMHELFLAAAVPALISAVVMFSLRWVMQPSATSVAASEAVVH